MSLPRPAHPHSADLLACAVHPFNWAQGKLDVQRAGAIDLPALLADDVGGGKTTRDWEARFELAYQKCKDENVTLVGGVAPTAVSFARYLHKKHKVYPKDLWKTQIVTLGSVPGINTR